MARSRAPSGKPDVAATHAFVCSLVQGEAAGLEQGGHGDSRYWQWCFADAEDQEALSAVLQRQPRLVQAQWLAGQQLRKLRLTLLTLLKGQIVAAPPQEAVQQTQQQMRLPADVMQQRVNTLVALQQLEERCELLSRGLVIAERHAIGTISHSRAKRNGRGVTKLPSILALHKSACSTTAFLAARILSCCACYPLLPQKGSQRSSCTAIQAATRAGLARAWTVCFCHRFKLGFSSANLKRRRQKRLGELVGIIVCSPCCEVHLAVRRVASICPWTNRRFFGASPRIVYGGAAGIVHMKGVQISGFRCHATTR